MYKVQCSLRFVQILTNQKRPSGLKERFSLFYPVDTPLCLQGSCADSVSAYGLTHPPHAYNLLRYSAIIGDQSRFRFLRGKFSFSFDLSFVLICVFFTLITYQPRLTLTLKNLHPDVATHPIMLLRTICYEIVNA